MRYVGTNKHPPAVFGALVGALEGGHDVAGEAGGVVGPLHQGVQIVLWAGWRGGLLVMAVPFPSFRPATSWDWLGSGGQVDGFGYFGDGHSGLVVDRGHVVG